MTSPHLQRQLHLEGRPQPGEQAYLAPRKQLFCNPFLHVPSRRSDRPTERYPTANPGLLLRVPGRPTVPTLGATAMALMCSSKGCGWVPCKSACWGGCIEPMEVMQYFGVTHPKIPIVAGKEAVHGMQ